MNGNMISHSGHTHLKRTMAVVEVNMEDLAEDIMEVMVVLGEVIMEVLVEVIMEVPVEVIMEVLVEVTMEVLVEGIMVVLVKVIMEVVVGVIMVEDTMVEQEVQKMVVFSI